MMTWSSGPDHNSVLMLFLEEKILALRPNQPDGRGSVFDVLDMKYPGLYFSIFVVGLPPETLNRCKNLYIYQDFVSSLFFFPIISEKREKILEP